MTSPCCGCSLQTGSKIIAILQIIGSIAVIVMILIAIFNTAEMEAGTWIILGLNLIIAFVRGGMGGLLLAGTNERDIKKVEIWIWTNLILLILYGVLFAVLIFTVGVVQALAQDVVVLILSIYFLAVVYAFKSELQQEQGNAGLTA